MNTFLLRVFLSAVFAIAGFAKLAARSRAAASLTQFGVARAWSSAAAAGLAVAELACGAALLVPSSAWWGGIAASVLLTVFTAVIAVTMASGRRPACHCFGQVLARPISAWTLTRNSLLLAAALVVVAAGPAGADADFPPLALPIPTAALAMALSALAVATLMGMGGVTYMLLKQNGRLLVRLEAIEKQLGLPAEAWAEPAWGLPVGSPAPEFRLRSVKGADVSLAALQSAGRPLLLVFGGSDCSGCEALLPEIAAWQDDLGLHLTVALVTRGANQEAHSAGHKIEHVLVTADDRVWQAFRVQLTPSAVLVKNGVTASPLAAGADAIRALVDTQRVPAKPGDWLPALVLPDLDGQSVDPSALRGLRTLLLFWSPSCGFCQRMLDDITAWEHRREPGSPSLLVISSGSVEENRRLGFRSPVLLDDAFRLGRVLGVSGTPAAILADEYGRVASGIGTGAEAVFALAAPQSLTTSHVR